MNFAATLQELYREKERLDRVIESLEALATGDEVHPRSRRGRKNMPEEERLIVSERMKKYWANRQVKKS